MNFLQISWSDGAGDPGAGVIDQLVGEDGKEGLSRTLVLLCLMLLRFGSYLRRGMNIER